MIFSGESNSKEHKGSRRAFLRNGGLIAAGATAAVVSGAGMQAAGAQVQSAIPIYYPQTPARLYDSRGPGAGGRLGSGTIRGLSFSPPLPSEAVGAGFNLTVTETVGSGFLAAYALGVPPGTSSINWFGDNQNIANFLILGFGTFMGNPLHGLLIQCGGTGSTQFVIDAYGYTQMVDVTAPTAASTDDASRKLVFVEDRPA